MKLRIVVFICFVLVFGCKEVDDVTDIIIEEETKNSFQEDSLTMYYSYTDNSLNVIPGSPSIKLVRIKSNNSNFENRFIVDDSVSFKVLGKGKGRAYIREEDTILCDKKVVDVKKIGNQYYQPLLPSSCEFYGQKHFYIGEQKFNVGRYKYDFVKNRHNNRISYEVEDFGVILIQPCFLGGHIILSKVDGKVSASKEIIKQKEIDTLIRMIILDSTFYENCKYDEVLVERQY